MAALIALAVLGTLNGNSFLSFGVVATIVYLRRRMWIEAIAAASIPMAWELIAQSVWAEPRPFAAHDPVQLLLEGPAFAYGILDRAITDTLNLTTMTSAVMTVLVLGTLALLSVGPRWHRTPLSGRVVAALSLAVIVTMVALVASRLSRGVALSAVGGYSYLFLVALFPLSGILLAHVARTRAALAGAAGIFVVVAMIGLAVINANARDLGDWKISGQLLMQTAAAELEAGTPTFPEQIPVPDTAPTVDQEWLRTLVSTGQIPAVVAGPVQVDQVSLNMQWRVVSTDQTTGVCQGLLSGQTARVPAGASVTMIGRRPAQPSTFDIPTAQPCGTSLCRTNQCVWRPSRRKPPLSRSRPARSWSAHRADQQA